MIAGFNVKDVAIGTGDTNSYNVGFLVDEVTDLLVWVQDSNGVVQGEYRGDDTTFLAGLTFNTDGETMALGLQNNLNDGWTLTFIVAPDAPDQDSSFSDKFGFNLSDIEGALDSLSRFIQRASYLGQRAMVLHDLDDIDSFNPGLPFGLPGIPGGLVSVKADGSGFECVITTGTIALAQTNATQAASSASAAAASATSASASAIAAAASAALAQAGYYVQPGTGYGSPLVMGAATTITPNNKQREMMFWASTGGAVTNGSATQIAAGTTVGQELLIFGCSDTNTIKLVDGNGIHLKGNVILGDQDQISFVWNGANWIEMWRNANA